MPGESKNQDDSRGARTRSLVSLIADIAVPMVVYYVLVAFGWSSGSALVAATIAIGVLVLAVALKDRKVDGFGIFVLVVCAVTLLVSLVSGDERVLLAKDPATSGLAGLVFLGSIFLGRPVTFFISRRIRALSPARKASWDRLYAAEADFRRMHRVSTLGWGIVLVAEAVVRLTLIYLLPVSVMVALSTAIELVAITGVVVWTVWYRRRSAGGNLEKALRSAVSVPAAV
ncbi:VC0807 family protein [Amycolatopsis sp. lyj-112]|uniref:VC0807 family protein n=1 Tax=Amycolatopsis sp. lyj-112 TaxID=2789288 RepID=UPI00397E3166